MDTKKISNRIGNAVGILFFTLSTFQISGLPSKSDPELQVILDKVNVYMEKLDIKPEYKVISISFAEDLPYGIYARCSISNYNINTRHITFNISRKYLLTDNPKTALMIILHENIHCGCNYQQHDEDSIVMSSTIDEDVVETYSQKYLDSLLNEAILTYCPHN